VTGGDRSGGADGGSISSSGGVTGAGGSTDGGQASASGGATVPSGSGGKNTGGATALAGAGGGTGGAASPRTNFTETVGSVSFDMVYVPGGTFTLGCEAATCPPDTKPVSDVKVSSYYIGKTEVTTALWNAVTGDGWDDAGGSVTKISWSDAVTFTCELGKKTRRNYRMMTEAEFEYAAKNHLGSLQDVGSSEEWAYNSWSSTHMGGTDPVGPRPGQPVQKTRRDVQGTVDNITGRLIRARDGLGPALRLTLSAEMDFPPDYGPPCDIPFPSRRNPQD
jgi:hypothetical protein